MPRIDLWRPSATRGEVDQPSREARLRQEHLERLFTLRMLPAQIWLRQVLCRLGLEFQLWRKTGSSITGHYSDRRANGPRCGLRSVSRREACTRRHFSQSKGWRANSAPHSPVRASPSATAAGVADGTLTTEVAPHTKLDRLAMLPRVALGSPRFAAVGIKVAKETRCEPAVLCGRSRFCLERGWSGDAQERAVSKASLSLGGPAVRIPLARPKRWSGHAVQSLPRCAVGYHREI
jgi:hypothetical protein